MINFDQKIKDLWGEHAKNTDQVIAAFDEAMTLAQNADQVKKVIHLVVHIYTDHRLDNNAAFEVLTQIENSKLNNVETLEIIDNSKNIFRFVDDPQLNISEYSEANQIKILAGAVSLLVFSKKYDQALDFLSRATSLAKNLANHDPSARSLAITGNNVACALGEKPERSAVESELMILAAKTGREFWEKAGSWLEVERAEYRLAQSYLKNRDFINSIKHANQCITICEKNTAPPLEFFYAFEAVTHVEKTIGQPLRSLEKMKHYFNLLSDDDKKYCSPALDFFMK